MNDPKLPSEEKARAVMNELLKQHTVCKELTLGIRWAPVVPEASPPKPVSGGRKSARPTVVEPQKPDDCQLELKDKKIASRTLLPSIHEGIKRQIDKDIAAIPPPHEGSIDRFFRRFSINLDEFNARLRENYERDLRARYYQAADEVLGKKPYERNRNEPLPDHGLTCRPEDTTISNATSCTVKPKNAPSR